MRWIDIDLRKYRDTPETESQLMLARERSAGLSALQDEFGADAGQLLRELEEIGRMLFRACLAHVPAAFSPDREADGSREPWIVGLDRHGAAIGYHLVVDRSHLTLPWTCLHNGMGFLLERHPLCVDTNGSGAPAVRGDNWARRREDVLFTEQALGPVGLDEIIERIRSDDEASPEILYLNSSIHDRRTDMRRQEGERLNRSLSTRGGLAAMEQPNGALTPGGVIRSGRRYQGFHFADDTMKPAVYGGAGFASDWLSPDPEDIGAAGDLLELEPVGVDQIDALLDSISERVETGRTGLPAQGRSSMALGERSACLMTEDGPLNPEDLGVHAATPPLVFANSYRGLAELGARFIEAGASVCLGPQAKIPYDCARRFAEDFYHHLGGGLSVAEAGRMAALDMRRREGDWSPLWLLYGVIGQGGLALQYI